ncbi:Hypothetical predicted protein [Mytilus galloprovincialis]|uniref:Uncharacterized protein n=1 Tax=Mytilus galloprovincialis TaxID=29158 RepID=A0A8B6HR99_MYTGA|nr:Hypothetical predicted protein [Mytilus galloprovincialis]
MIKVIYSRAASDGEEEIKIGKMIPRPCTLIIQSDYETPKITSAEMLHYINSEINLDISALIGYFQSTGINKFSASFRDEHSKEIFQDAFGDQFEVQEVTFNVEQAEPLQCNGKIKKEPLTLLCSGNRFQLDTKASHTAKSVLIAKHMDTSQKIVQSQPRKAWSSARTHPTRTRTNSNESLSTQDSQESQDSQETTIVSSGEIEVEIYQDKETIEVTQTSTSDSTPIEETLNESKSSNESIDHEIIITQALQVKFDKPQSETEKINEKQKGKKKKPNQTDYNDLMEDLTEILGTISESDPEKMKKKNNK